MNRYRRRIKLGIGAWLACAIWLCWPFLPSSLGGVDLRERKNIRQVGTLLLTDGDVYLHPVQRPEQTASAPADLGYGDGLRTGLFAAAAGEFDDHSAFRLREETVLVIEPPPTDTNRIEVRIDAGEVEFSHRRGPREVGVLTPYIRVVPRGTQYLVSVDRASSCTRVVMYDGEVTLRRDQEETHIHGGQTGIVRPGQPIEVRPLIEAHQTVQWWLYYPAVLDPAEILHEIGASSSLAASVEAYRTGDLRTALMRYPGFPSSFEAVDRAEKIYLASLLLANNGIREAQALLSSLEESSGLVRALRLMIQAVTAPDPMGANPRGFQPLMKTNDSATASEWLALSYCQQASSSRPRALEEALGSARQAVRLSSGFGYAWARIAELEFSLGRIPSAREAIRQALRCSPHHAQAQAVHGFLLAANNHRGLAQAAFEQAILCDPTLANGWLGRGLCRIRGGDRAGGASDLRAAAALEPRRALIRSYAGKAFLDAGQPALARRELDYAQRLDPMDPTPWLYNALLLEQENRSIEAIEQLEESARLNDNRRVYRSQLLLDQDRALRRANLARLYEDVGLAEVALQEASEAVNADYGNSSAHAFLANSFSAFRDPRQINLRYETPWFSEFLTANLLAPAGMAMMSQNISQNEYARFFDCDGWGVVNETEWTSQGGWLEQGTHYGRWGGLSYSIDTAYRSEEGTWPNTDLEQWTTSARLKYQLTPRDSLLAEATYYEASSGDVRQAYAQEDVAPGLRLKERHQPLTYAGWHREWHPGLHTILLVAPWRSTLWMMNGPELRSIPVWNRNELGAVVDRNFAWRSQTLFTGVSVELQEIWQLRSHTLVGGLRYQCGSFDVSTEVSSLAPILFDSGPQFPRQDRIQPDVERWSLYVYDQWQLHPKARLTAGLVRDELRQPINYRIPPVQEGERDQSQWSPKLGLSINPWRRGVLRGAYTRSLSGVSFDQSFRLEPVQVAGFNQAFRGLMPESLTGSVAGQEMETWGLAFDQAFPTGTYATLSLEWLRSQAERAFGFYETDYNLLAIGQSTSRERLSFEEQALSLKVGQFVGRNLALTAQYRRAENILHDRILGPWPISAPSRDRSLMNQLALGIRFQHPSGFFSSWESTWTHQENNGSHLEARPGDDFWQHDLWAGWRFRRRQAELAVGLLNVTGQNYHLYPLNYYCETSRERTLALRARFQF